MILSFDIPTPRVELNVTEMSQNSIKEKGEFALDVDKVDATSVEPGIGFTIDKTITMANGIKVTPNTRAMYYRETGTPYEDINGTMSSVSKDNFKIEGYNADKNRGEFSVGVKFERNSLNVNAGVEFKVDSQGNEITPFIGLGYKF